jgi:transcriptional regulator with XRE-family HTH domain
LIAGTDVGERLWELREERGWSQKRTAREAGLSHVTVAHLETGKVEPRMPTLRKLARTFGMTVDEFLGVEDSTETSALQLEEMYVADAAIRRTALEAASEKEREAYAATIDRVIRDVTAGIPEWDKIADDEVKSEGERRVARETLERLWKHIDRLRDLRVEATGEAEEPLGEAELAEFIATHARVA